MSKIDFKKVLPTLYNPSAKVFSVVEVPQLNFLMMLRGRIFPFSSGRKPVSIGWPMVARISITSPRLAV